jgi:hypothetical protein
MSANMTMLLDDYTLVNGAYGNVFLAALLTVSVDGNAYAVAVGASSNPSGANLWTDGGGYMMVEDIGPNRGQQ